MPGCQFPAEQVLPPWCSPTPLDYGRVRPKRVCSHLAEASRGSKRRRNCVILCRRSIFVQSEAAGLFNASRNAAKPLQDRVARLRGQLVAKNLEANLASRVQSNTCPDNPRLLLQPGLMFVSNLSQLVCRQRRHCRPERENEYAVRDQSLCRQSYQLDDECPPPTHHVILDKRRIL
jgi:hypothetical protein